MYFIKRGLAKVVCADDEGVVISYLGEGAYFGEIGVLITGKRSTSVIAHTDCLLLSIDKEALLAVLAEFGHHKKFLEMVAKQRLETTHTSEIQIPDASPSNMEVTNANANSNGNLNQRSDGQNSESGTLRSNSLAKGSKQQISAKTAMRLDAFITAVVLLAVLWNIGYTVFALCFELSITDGHPALIAIDTIALLVYAADIAYQIYVVPLRYPYSSVASSSANLVELRAIPFSQRITLGFVLELISTFPIDYLYYATGTYENWLRLFRLLKIVRMLDVDRVFKSYFANFHLYNVVRLILFYCVSSHVFSCILYVIAKHAYEEGGRFDGGYYVLSQQH